MLIRLILSACLLAGFWVPTAGLALLHAETKTERETHQILGGRPIQEGEFPYVLVLRIEGVGRCNATLISRKWLLTAGHCVTDEDGTIVAASRIRIALNGDSPGFTGIGRVIVHPEHRTTPANRVDLALLEIPIGFPFNVEPVKIADISQETDAYLKDTPATAVGWGQIAGQRYTHPAHKVEIPWWTAQDCIKERSIVVPAVVHDRTLCAGYQTAGPAVGDSGSPLLIPTSQGSHVQIGVSSTRTIGRSGGIEFVPVYMRLTSFHDWIYSHVGEDEPAPRPPEFTILTHVFAGPLATSTAETEITITNRTQEPCRASVWFHRGTEEAPAVRFNGQYLDGNRMEIDMEGGTVHRVLLTVDPGQDLAVGAAYVEQEAGCSAGDLQVEGRYLITDREGQIREVFSVLPQTDSDWLSDGECRLLSNRFGSRDNIGRDNIGLAMVTAQPEEAAPSGTKMTFEAYDWQGNFVEEPPSLEVTGAQHALNPWEFSEPRLVKLCLDVPDDQPTGFRLSLISIAARVSSRNVQYYSSALIRP